MWYRCRRTVPIMIKELMSSRRRRSRIVGVARDLSQRRPLRQAHSSIGCDAGEENHEGDNGDSAHGQIESASDDQLDALTRAFVRLTELSSYPLDRLNRYEASLWRQACQVLFALRYLDRCNPSEVWVHNKRR